MAEATFVPEEPGSNSQSDSKDEKSDNQMALVSIDIACECGDGNLKDGDKLYFCNYEDCANKKYCEDCLEFHHKYNKKKKKWKSGHRLDMQQTTLINELIQFRENKNWIRMGAEKLRQLIGKERFDQLAPYVTNVNCLASVGTMAATLASEAAIIRAAITAGKGFQTTNVLKYGGYTAVAFVAVETMYHMYRYTRGDICGKEFFKLTSKSVCRNAAIWGVGVISAKLGAAVGAFAGPVGSAIGFIVGGIIGAVGSYYSAQKVDELFDEFWKIDDDEARKRLIQEALIYFHYSSNGDIKNRTKFNRKELQKKFRQYALEVHPDRPSGSTEEFQKLTMCYGALFDLCEKSDEDKTTVQKCTASLPFV